MKDGSAWVGFTVVALVASGIAVALAALLSKDPWLVRAVTVSAVLAALVQLAGFACAKYLLGRKIDLFAAWGAAMVVRMASLVIYALVVFKAPDLGLAPVAAPTLVTFALLLFVTSIAEPLFLNSSKAA